MNYLSKIKIILILLISTSLLILSSCKKEKPIVEVERKVSKMDTIINNASQLKNTIVANYPDASRSSFYIKNSKMEMVHDLMRDGYKQVTSLKAKGSSNNLLENSMDIVVENIDGTKHNVSNGGAGRVNIFRHGLYYYDVHLYDLFPDFQNSSLQFESKKTFDFNDGTENWNKVHSMSEPIIKDGCLYSKITGEDPYIFNVAMSLDINNCPDIQIKVKSEGSSSMQVFFATDKDKNMDGAKSISVPIIGDSNFRTYTINMKSLKSWNGKLTELRFDFDGGFIDNEVYIDSISIGTKSASAIPAKMEKVFHVYPDKMHEEDILHITGNANLKSVYYEIKVNSADYSNFVIKDSDGIHNFGDSYNKNTVSYVGMSGNKGTLGYIFPMHNGNGEVEIINDATNYIIRQYAKLPSGVLKDKDEIIFGRRIYATDEGGLEKLDIEANIELNPLTESNISVERGKDKVAKFTGYDNLKGYYKFASDGLNFNSAYKEDKANYYPSVKINIQNDILDRNIYIQQYASKIAGCLESAALLDENDNAVPLPIEVCKNFKGENEEPFYNPSDTAFSESYYPLLINKNESIKFTSLHLYQNWGNHPLKQISSISFFTPYYHLSTGVTETTCWAPFQYGGKNGFLITDYRPMSGKQWADQPQYDSAGEHRIMTYKSDNGRNSLLYRSTQLNSVGPNYTDMTLFYGTDDNKADISINVKEFPQSDETRVFMKLNVKFTDDLKITNPEENFSIYNIRSFVTQTRYLEYAFLNSKNEPESKQINFSDKNSETNILGTKAPFIALYNIDKEKSIQNMMANLSAIVKSSHITINGKEYKGNLAVNIKKYPDGNTEASLTIKKDELNFKKGDVIEMELILMPYGSNETKNYDNVINERNRYGLTPFKLDVTKGKKISEFTPVIKADAENVEFAITGGFNTIPIQVEGFSEYLPPKLYEKVGEQWTEVSNTANGKDGVQVYIDDKGTYGFAFLYKTDGAKHIFKVSK